MSVGCYLQSPDDGESDYVSEAFFGPLLGVVKIRVGGWGDRQKRVWNFWTPPHLYIGLKSHQPYYIFFWGKLPQCNVVYEFHLVKILFGGETDEGG